MCNEKNREKKKRNPCILTPSLAFVVSKVVLVNGCHYSMCSPQHFAPRGSVSSAQQPRVVDQKNQDEAVVDLCSLQRCLKQRRYALILVDGMLWARCYDHP